MKYIMKLFFLSFTLLVGCSSSESNNIELFKYPIVYQNATVDSLSLFKEEELSYSKTHVIGKSRFVDSLFIPVKRAVDTNFYKSMIGWSKLDSLGSDGLEIYPDYSSQILFNRPYNYKATHYYPVYIVNQTPLTKVFNGKDNYVFAIQEAYKDGFWFPIEGRCYDFCGNGYWNLKIESKEYLTVLFPKYEGDFETHLRVRIKNGNSIYVSRPFKGVINEKQFLLNKEKSYHYGRLIEEESDAVQDLFYGAKPREVWDENFGTPLHVVY